MNMYVGSNSIIALKVCISRISVIRYSRYYIIIGFIEKNSTN